MTHRPCAEVKAVIVHLDPPNKAVMGANHRCRQHHIRLMESGAKINLPGDSGAEGAAVEKPIDISDVCHAGARCRTGWSRTHHGPKLDLQHKCRSSGWQLQGLLGAAGLWVTLKQQVI